MNADDVAKALRRVPDVVWDPDSGDTYRLDSQAVNTLTPVVMALADKHAADVLREAAAAVRRNFVRADGGTELIPRREAARVIERHADRLDTARDGEGA